MSIITKALQAAALLNRKTAADPGATIRSALRSAGLMPTAGVAEAPADEALGCMAPPGAASVLSAFKADWSRLRGVPAASAEEAPAGTFTWRTVSGAWGERRYRLFVPAGVERPAALVVMLHGCTQTPDDFAAGTRMNAVAAEHGVAVAYPEQIRAANVSSCWNWFDASHQSRGAGEPALIAAVARTVQAELGIPDGRVFAAGLSAGGAMAAVMAHTHPELFAAVGIHSGLPYLAASDVSSAFAAMRGGGGAAAVVEGAVIPGVPAIIFHGDADRTVHVSNADGIVRRLAAAGERPTVETGTAGGRSYTRTVGRDTGGAVRFEDWRLRGAGHAWSGGSPAGSYTDPAGPDASREMMRFFLEQARPTM